jgi:dCMP deaminase
MARPSNDTLYLEMAKLIATRGTCPRRQVGCVLVDKRGRVLSMGYNGVPSGRPHCTDTPCPGANLPSGTGLDKCEAIHAEQNAVVLLADPWVVHTAYITVSPCHSCVKLLLATSCQRIVCEAQYAHSEATAEWRRNGREIIFAAK